LQRVKFFNSKKEWYTKPDYNSQVFVSFLHTC
jgi:hypothetical protein